MGAFQGGVQDEGAAGAGPAGNEAVSHAGGPNLYARLRALRDVLGPNPFSGAKW